ncbi:MAG: hypothetical protein HY013_05635, partial [Candidatus Solibacter usitatus]|nr:hypothetical protein [Candidatus Solibacter usitatus]
QRWSLGFQRQLAAGILVEAGYLGNRGTRLQIARDINTIPGSALSTSPERDQRTIDFLNQSFSNPFFGLDPVFTRNISRSQLARPYPEFGNLQVTEPIGYSWYHALEIRAERRFAAGFTFQTAYTWSKAMEATEFLNSFETAPYRTVSSFDRPKRWAFSGIYELPFGKSRRFLGGWQLNALIQHQSGAPLDFGNLIFRGNIRDIALPSDQRSVDRWINVDAGFERASARQLASNVRTFPLRFASVRGDGQMKWDLSAIKYFRLTERAKVQFRAEAYNALNHPNFENPATNNVTVSGFGQVSNVAGTARQFQFAVKVTF